MDNSEHDPLNPGEKEKEAMLEELKDFQARVSGSWNWDVDDAANSKRLEDLPENEHAEVEAALLKKREYRAELATKEAEKVEMDKAKLDDLRWACYWFAHNNPGTPVPEEVCDALQDAIDSQEDRIMDDIYPKDHTR
jgi:hypothetical protein